MTFMFFDQLYAFFLSKDALQFPGLSLEKPFRDHFSGYTRISKMTRIYKPLLQGNLSL